MENIEIVKELMNILTDEQRLIIINSYCKYCGSKNPNNCKCIGDD